MAIVSLSSHKFVRFPCCYYRLKNIKNKNFRVASNGVTSLRDFIRICSSVLKLKHCYRQTDMISSICALFFFARRSKPSPQSLKLTMGNSVPLVLISLPHSVKSILILPFPLPRLPPVTLISSKYPYYLHTVTVKRIRHIYL